jgi:hypothetical protein
MIETATINAQISSDSDISYLITQPVQDIFENTNVKVNLKTI